MIGRVLDNRYELVEMVGKGGMALVYRALDRRTGHAVAVKILRPEFNQDKEFLGRFQREATTASKLNHHNIVNLLDVGQEGEIHYIVMEYVRGRTLKEVIRQKGALPYNVAAQIGIRILSALQHAHKNGIIHRDIKPQNILVHSDGHIKVADFGIARVAGSNTISTDDMVMGSVHYFSPEQAKGESVTIASDLYSVGVSLYEMITAQPPFDGETPVSVAMQHINVKARPMSDFNPAVPPAMERVVAKAMEKRPEARYQSALEMAQDLQRALQEPDGTWLGRLPDKPIPSLATPTSRQKAIHQKKRQLRLRLIGIAAAAVMMVCLGIATWLIFDQIMNTAQAPYCIEETEADALRLLQRSGLNGEARRVSDENVAAGYVVSQTPEFNTQMRKGDTVVLFISTGPEEQAVPKLTGKSLSEAQSEAEQLGFRIIYNTKGRLMSTAPWDTVLEQSPDSGEILASGEAIVVTLSGGCVTLPDLVNMDYDEAMLLIQKARIHCEEIRQIPTGDASQLNRIAAQVYSEKDAADRRFEPGAQVMEGQAQVILAVYVAAQDASAADNGGNAPSEGVNP